MIYVWFLVYLLGLEPSAGPFLSARGVDLSSVRAEGTSDVKSRCNRLLVLQVPQIMRVWTVRRTMQCQHVGGPTFRGLHRRFDAEILTFRAGYLAQKKKKAGLRSRMLRLAVGAEQKLSHYSEVCRR